MGILLPTPCRSVVPSSLSANMKIFLFTLCLVASTYAAPQKIVQEEAALAEVEEASKAPYTFGFEVRDDDTTNYQNRAEAVDEDGVLRGSYSYVMPDGFVYTVTYINRNDGTGHEAQVTRAKSGIDVITPEPWVPESKKAKSSRSSKSNSI